MIIDRGTNVIDPKRGVKRTRNEELEEVRDEIHKGHPYGAIWRAHGSFCFWYRRHVIDYIKDYRGVEKEGDSYEPAAPW